VYIIIYDYDDGYPTYGVTTTKQTEAEAKKLVDNLKMSDYCFNIEVFENTLENERGIGNEKI